MPKKLTAAWNARTPDYLHPYTRENLVWQLKLTAVLIVVLSGKSAYEEYQERKKRARWSANDK